MKHKQDCPLNWRDDGTDVSPACTCNPTAAGRLPPEQLAEITQFSTFIRNRWDTSIHTVERQAAEIKRLTDALEEIAKKEGPYKIDPHEFACAVIESMAGIAKAALKEQDKA